ncbi:MAG: lamin tail domain-containing protein [Myxococcaceae bacterium]|nr:lamin tail domain-containing protein [Myxococcaceae bacterium]MCA3016912.1 lamin tail domain-containing protein [Myxococcaceae bacterium]
MRASLVMVLASVSCGLPPEEPPRAERTRQALSTGLVISEVYGGSGASGSAYRYDFVELFNRGSTPQSLSGWALQYASSAGSSWMATPLNGTVQPGRSFLVRMGAQGSGAALPAADDTGSTTMSSTAGKVALTNSTTTLTGSCPMGSTVVDFVGYGAATTCSEGMPTPNTSAAASVRRRGEGCVETDDNAADFTVGAPTPRNASSASINCATVDAGTPPPPLSDAGCTVFTSFQAVEAAGQAQPANETSGAQLSSQVAARSDGGMDVVRFEAYYGFQTLTLPATRTFSTSDTYRSCELCALFRRRCNARGTCFEDYFAQSGTGTVLEATPDGGAGRFRGSLSNVQFVRWDFLNDVPVAGGGCIILGAASFDVSWDEDAGVGGGSADGGSAGGGSAGGGSAGGGSAGGGSAGGGSAGGGSAGGGSAGGGSAGGFGGAGGGFFLSDAGRADGGVGNITTRQGCGCTMDGGLALELGVALVCLTRRRRRSAA